LVLERVAYSAPKVLLLCVLANKYVFIVYLRPEMKNIATNRMPGVVSDLPYDFKKMFETCPQELGWAS
jgi:hypothetical protein